MELKCHGKVCKIGMRHVQVILLFLNSAIISMNRLHMATTILAMMDLKNNTNFPTFNWNATQKSLILSSFYWGYIVGQLPSGLLVRRYKVKATLFVCMFSTGIFSLLIPFCVPSGDWPIFCLLRALQGLFQSSYYAGFLSHLAHWSPAGERSLFFCLSSAAFYFGSALATLLGGLIAVSSLGWPGTFYILSGLCFIWCVIWCLFAANDYTASKYITPEESAYIANSLQQSMSFESKLPPIPWRQIVRSAPMWSILLSGCMESFSGTIFFYCMPTYLQTIHGVLLEDNALFSALPHIVEWIALYFLMFLGEWIMKRKLLTLTVMRKCFQTFGMWLPALLTLWISFLGKRDKVLAIILYTVLVSSSTATTNGADACKIDIAPNHAAILTPLINTPAILMDLIAPIIAGQIIEDGTNLDNWRIVFELSAAIYFVGNIIFLIWGTTQEQPWNTIEAKVVNDVNIMKTSNNELIKTLEISNPVYVDDL